MASIVARLQPLMPLGAELRALVPTNDFSQALRLARSWILASSLSTAARQQTRVEPHGIIEVREYSLHPEHVNSFVAASNTWSMVRARHYNLLGAFLCDTGGDISRVVHYYHFKNFQHRDDSRRAASRDADMKAMNDELRPYIRTKESTILRQADQVYKTLGLACTSAYVSPPQQQAQQQQQQAQQPVYEMRTYRFQPGQDGVNRLVAAYLAGLPPKRAAEAASLTRQGSSSSGSSGSGGSELLLLGYADVGLLNTVHELVRYPSAQRLIDLCDASRSVPEWQAAKKAIYPLLQSLTISFMHPVAFSTWQ